MAADLPDLPPPPDPRVRLRGLQPGDAGWVVAQHGALYAREWGYDASFEALVAQLLARWLVDHDPACERGWIAELDGQPVGSVFLVRKSRRTAQLRLLILRPEARGLGLGQYLTDVCIAQARAWGYRRMVLWTHAQLRAARAIYTARGFRLDSSEPLHAYGQDLVSETWSLPLAPL